MYGLMRLNTSHGRAEDHGMTHSVDYSTKLYAFTGIALFPLPASMSKFAFGEVGWEGLRQRVKLDRKACIREFQG